MKRPPGEETHATSRVIDLMFELRTSLKQLRPGEPCSHRGCLSHVTHPCEGCGRTAGEYPRPAPVESIEP